MLYAVKNIEGLEKVAELFALQDQIKEVRLQDKFGKQNYHYDSNKLFEPMIDTIKNTSENITKTITETSIKNNEAISDLNEKVLELMSEKGLIAPYLASSLVNLFKPGNKINLK